MNRVRSSRRLEAESKRNVEVMWLLEKLTPDDKAICNFRKDNAKQLKLVFREFSLMCNRLGLYGRELIAVDGTKNRANSSRKNIHTKKGTVKKLAEIEKKISKYMNELECNDEAEKADEKVDNVRVAEILEHLKRKKEALSEWLKKIDENDGKEISTFDPDAHLMHTNGDGRNLDACYNVQAVVDSKHKLIVDFEVTTRPDDKNALPKMTEKAKEIMGVSEITAVADTGYYDGEDIEKCEQNGIATYVAKAGDYAHAPDRSYDKSKFTHDFESDCYICPNGQRLSFARTAKTAKSVQPPRKQGVQYTEITTKTRLTETTREWRIITAFSRSEKRLLNTRLVRQRRFGDTNNTSAGARSERLPSSRSSS